MITGSQTSEQSIKKTTDFAMTKGHQHTAKKQLICGVFAAANSNYHKRLAVLFGPILKKREFQAQK